MGKISSLQYRIVLLILIIFCLMKPSMLSSVPVVYVCFGVLPLYLKVNIELASRNNPVVVLYDSKEPSNSSHGIIYVPLDSYLESASKFAPSYRHLSKDSSNTRRDHELKCFKRWFILQDYMTINQIDRVFFGDGDTSVFVNVTKAFNLRSYCSAMINVEAQMHHFHWVGAGESSLWTLQGIRSFCTFTSQLYSVPLYLKTIATKHLQQGSSVVDMSALWLWFVVNMRHAKGWDTGRPFQPHWCERKRSCESYRSKYDSAFAYSAALALPSKDNIHICNGLDIIDGTTFDHMHGWSSGTNFSLNLDSDGIPSYLGLINSNGGKPESIEENDIKKLMNRKIRMNTLHYQGNAKNILPYDVCRVLWMTGSGTIYNDEVAVACSNIKSKTADYPSCHAHSNTYGSDVCF